MNTSGKQDTKIKDILANDIVSSLGIAHNAALYIHQNEALTIKGFAKAQTVLSAISNAMRAVVILKDVYSSDIDNDLLNMNYCNIESFFTKMTDELNLFFASETDVSFKYSSKLEKKRTFYININLIEKILYALIYCLVKSLDENDKKEIKLSIDEKSGKNRCYIITISSKGKPLSKSISDIFSKKIERMSDFYDLDVISLSHVLKIVKSLHGGISYITTKTMNKFVFTLPHLTEFDNLQYYETIEYQPDTNFIKGYFYDLTL